MSREKQIDEIAKLICNFPQCINYNSIGECKPTECQIADKAEALYNTGYRKQIKAEWIISSDGYYPYCSNCKNEPKNGVMTDYCPNCGARMKGEGK